MGNHVLRYRVDLATDDNLRWFACVEVHSDGKVSWVAYTVTAETWVEALELAKALISQYRGWK